MALAPLIHQYKQQSQALLSPDIWHYLQSDAGDGKQNAYNENGWYSSKVMPRPLRKLINPTTACEIFGEHWAHPILLAPVAYQKLFHMEAECGVAMACNAQQGQMMVSSLASQPLEEIIAHAQQPLWFQLYWQGNRERTAQLLRKAINAGYRVVVFTVDAPVKQALIDLPENVSAVNLSQPLRPFSVGEQSTVFHGWMPQAPTWDDVAWLRDQLNYPLILKGIMHPDDARQAIQLGCDGLIISNHGGRVMDGTPSMVEQLPKIVSAIRGQCKLIVDSGIRNGVDVFKAIALGADAVSVGRPYIWGLTAEGAMGVAKVIRCLRDELELTMALHGTSHLAAIQQIEII